MARRSAAGRDDEAWFGDPAQNYRSAAVDLVRLGGLDAVSLPALALRTGRSVADIAAEFRSTDELRERLGRYLAVTVCHTVLEVYEKGGRVAAARALVAMAEQDPAVFRQALTGRLFSAGEDLALRVVRVFLPDAEIPESEGERRRWFDYMRSHLHAAVLTAAEFPDPDLQSEILVGAKNGAMTVSELFNSVSAAEPELASSVRPFS